MNRNNTKSENISIVQLHYEPRLKVARIYPV